MSPVEHNTVVAIMSIAQICRFGFEAGYRKPRLFLQHTRKIQIILRCVVSSTGQKGGQ